MKGQLTFDAEGREGGRWHSRILHVPSSSSGLTLGRGYDMRDKGRDTIIQDLANAGVPAILTSIIANAAGLRGDKAKDFISEYDLQSFEISKAGQVDLFKVVYSRLEKDVIRICSKSDVVKLYGATSWEGLDDVIRDVLVDLRFRGDYTPSSRRLLQKHVANNDVEAFSEAISDASNWTQVPRDRVRRRKEYVTDVQRSAKAAPKKSYKIQGEDKLQLLDILKTVGTGIISAVVPGAGALIGAVNAVLPDSMQLPSNATGSQVKEAVDSLQPEQRAKLLEKEFEVEITQIKESNDTVRTMLTADASMKHSTRPYIAKGSFQVIAIVTLVVISLWAYGVGAENVEIVNAVVDGWPFILAVTAPLVVLLKAYFGVLEREHKTKLDAANGVHQPAGIAGILASITGKK